MALLVVGFDSAWTDNPRSPGALSFVFVEHGLPVEQGTAELATFDTALKRIKILSVRASKTLVAVDQPLVVRNQTGSRPVEKVAASVVSWIGGGVQPSSRSKVSMFGDHAPIWRFLHELRATTDPKTAAEATSGIHAIEVFPALALPTLNPAFCGWRKHPKYNPANRAKFRIEDWDSVCATVGHKLEALAAFELSEQAHALGRLQKPRKADQDCLDSLICLVIGLVFAGSIPSGCISIGDETNGFIVTPMNAITDARLHSAAEAKSVPICVYSP